MIAIIVFGLPCMLALCMLVLCVLAFRMPAFCSSALCSSVFCAFSFRVLARCVLALCMRSLRYLRFACWRLRLFKMGRECGIVRPNVRKTTKGSSFSQEMPGQDVVLFQHEKAARNFDHIRSPF